MRSIPRKVVLMSSNDHDVSVLNSLIATVIDSADGYTNALKESDASRYYEVFQRRGAERQHLVTQLQGQVRTLGGTPEDDGTLLGSAHRVFTNLRNRVAGGDKAVIDEVEAGEDHIKHKFEDAMQDREVSPAVASMIETAYATVKDGHDEIRDLKHALHASV